MKKLRITLPILLIILTTFYACMKGDFGDTPNPGTDELTENLTVAENFDWSMTKTLNISVTLPDADVNRPLRIYTQDETELLYIGYAKSGSDIINSQITIPSYMEIVKVFYGFEDFYIPFEIGIDENLNYDFNEGLTTKSLKDSDDDYESCCKDGLRSLTMRFDGDNQETIQVFSKKDKKERIFLGANINPGESFTITNDGDKLAKDLYFYVGDSDDEDIKLSTDCKTKLYVNDSYGDFTIMAGISKDGLELCSKSSSGGDDCGCEGGLAYMKLRYIGTTAAIIQVKEKKDLKVIYSNTVQPNQEFTYTGTKKDGRLDNTIYVYVNGTLNASMHVSCSVPIAIGDQFGDFKIAEAYNGKNLTLCGDPLPDPDPGTDPGTGGGSTTTLSLDGSLAFEDLWPSKGDYDFNDLVIDYDFSVTKNEDEEVLSITSVFIIHAFGASFHNGFGFQLPNVVAGNIIEVTGYQIESPSIFDISSKGLENAQSKATIIVYDDSYNRMTHPGTGIGVNTTENAPFVTPDTLTVQITFYKDGSFGPSGAVTYSDLDIGNFNPFIIINQNRAREVHLADFEPTDLVDMDVFGTFNDNSIPASGRYYKSNLGLPWAINIPVVFDYPYEQKEVVRAYLKFAAWAESSGQSFPDWYLDEAGYRDDSLIYSAPN